MRSGFFFYGVGFSISRMKCVQWSCFLLLVLCSLVSSDDSDGQQCKGSTKAAKAETYLETAAALIDKLRENMPESGRADCSCPPQPMDCDEIQKCGHNRSGVFLVFPRNRVMVGGGVNVYCDMETSGGGWTVLQRRGDFKRPADFFHKSWQDYKHGFGDLRRDFWIGNENIYALTNQRKYYLRIDLTDHANNTRYAFYDQFWIDNESHHYKLHVYDYSGDSGDSLSRFHDGHRFSTSDRDNDNSTSFHCANRHGGGWWYAECLESNLNGRYYRKGEKPQKAGEGVIWTTFTGTTESLEGTEMKIRPMDFKFDLKDMDIEPV